MQVNTPQDEDVWPAIAVEVMHVGKHAIRGMWWSWEFHCWIKLVFRLKAGPFIPKRTSHEIHLSIAIDVAGGNAVAIIFIGQDLLFEGGQTSAFRGARLEQTSGRKKCGKKFDATERVHAGFNKF
jgi:hypothetical protein